MSERAPDAAPAGPLALRRTLGFWLLFFYGIGIIVGAGIYVLVGAVAGKAGMAAPFAFLLAGVLAGLTALSYAELVARLPEASGAVAYVHAATRHPVLAWMVGLAVLLVAITSGAAIARGSAGYVQRFIDVVDWLPGAVLVVAFTAIACLRVEMGARVAALFGALELGGLLFVIALGADALGTLPAHSDELVPRGLSEWQGLAAGAFLAFFAFIGFETLANMAEETRDVARTLPRAIVASIAAASLFYALLALISVLAVPLESLARSSAPLCLLLDRADVPCEHGFAAVALIALSNGVIVELMLVARLLYGMARRGLVPKWLGAVSARSRVPVRATLLGGAVMLLFVLTLPFERLAGLTSALTLAVFATVNISLVILKLRDRRAAAPRPAVSVPLAVPLLGAAACAGLLAAAL